MILEALLAAIDEAGLGEEEAHNMIDEIERNTGETGHVDADHVHAIIARLQRGNTSTQEEEPELEHYESVVSSAADERSSHRESEAHNARTLSVGQASAADAAKAQERKKKKRRGKKKAKQIRMQPSIRATIARARAQAQAVLTNLVKAFRCV